MRRWLAGLVAAAAVVAGLGLWITRPQALPADALAGLTGDAEAGALVFAAAGCGSCHTAPESEEPTLAGGKAFATPFGTFYAPNISPDPEHGIGGWSDLELASAIQRGVSPDGAHYYPVFPYSTYAKATAQDIADLIAYMRSLPASDTPNRAHEVGFPFSIRASLGGWKLLYGDAGWVMPESDDPALMRGRYLVEALGHCGECHTARNALGGLDRSAWLQGAPNAVGPGRIPGITPDQLGWTAQDIAIYLDSGFTPEFDTAGGEMVDVIKNTSQLTDDDRAAIAAYLLALP